MFCPNCGFNANDSRFCPSCGQNLTNTQAPAQPITQVQTNPAPTMSHEERTLWEGKPSGIVDKAKGALNSDTYKITNQRIVISGGLIGRRETEVEIRHIKDIKVVQSLTDKLSNVGSITIISSDITDGTFVLKNVNEPITVKEIIRKALHEHRSNLNIVYKENI